MKISRLNAVLAAGVAGVLALSACSSSGGGKGEGNNSSSASSASTGASTGGSTGAPSSGTSSSGGGTPATGGTVTVAVTNGFTSFNNLTPQSNLDTNGFIYDATSSNFNYIDNKLKVQKDPSFGTYQKLSDNPLTVKYTLNPQATWSDGVKVGVDDLLLSWAVFSGYYDDFTLKSDGTVGKGNQYFQQAGTALGPEGADVLTKFPKIDTKTNSITLTYDKPYADWEIAYSVTEPAHVIWKKAGLPNAAAFINLLKSTKPGNIAKPLPKNATLTKLAAVWNTGFDTKTLPSDKSLYLSDGPYVVSDIQAGQSVTLVANKAYKGDHTPKLDKIVVRAIGDAQSQVQALQNGDIDAAYPQPSADTLTALKAISGVNLVTYSQVSYDHIDLNHTGVFADKTVRQAFLKTIPRQQILQGIVTPVQPDAKVLNSELFLTNQPGYAESVASNGSSAYPGEPDVAGAKKLLAGKTPTVRLLFNSENPNRVNTAQLVQKYAQEAGFKVVLDGQKDWGSHLGDGSYDASDFGWINPGVGVSGVPQIFQSGQGGNYNGFKNAQVDALAKKLVITPDPTTQQSIEAQIDKLVFDDAYGLPLFQLPGIFASSKKIGGIADLNPGQAGPFWNTWEWTKQS